MPLNLVYNNMLYAMAGFLVVGFLANLLVRPVAERWYMKDSGPAQASAAAGGSYGIGRGGVSAPALLAWACVGLPLLWGVYITLTKALILFRAV